MAESEKVAKAELREIGEDGQEVKASRIEVQFNPETLKVSFSNQVVPPAGKGGEGGGTDQRETSTVQYVGKGTTKLSVQLWFDVTASDLPQPFANADDVRSLTKRVVHFITPQPSKKDPKMQVPPGVRFLWGTFQFDGIVESMEESLEFFSPQGKPLRASMSLSLSQQKIEFLMNPPKGAPQGPTTPSGGAPGTSPFSLAQAGQTLQGMANKLGQGVGWQDIAAANGIENPRLLRPGQLIDLNPFKPR